MQIWTDFMTGSDFALLLTLCLSLSLSLSLSLIESKNSYFGSVRTCPSGKVCFSKSNPWSFHQIKMKLFNRSTRPLLIFLKPVLSSSSKNVSRKLWLYLKNSLSTHNGEIPREWTNHNAECWDTFKSDFDDTILRTYKGTQMIGKGFEIQPSWIWQQFSRRTS